MKIGYPCINNSLECRGNSTFRLKSYSEERLLQTVENNLNCLTHILRYNVKKDLLFFRITSGLVPFASHEVCQFDWVERFSSDFKRIGKFALENNLRISMHPDQFTLLNSPSEDVTRRSFQELQYHADVLDALELPLNARIQVHVGGIYGDKNAALKRFVRRYQELPPAVAKRLTVENDDHLYSLRDCLRLHDETGVPILFDSFHHACFNNGEDMRDALEQAASTWTEDYGILMVDYSSQKAGARTGTHAESLDEADFSAFLEATRGLDFDIMLEIKDKEVSALKAIKIRNSLGLCQPEK